MHKQLLVSSFLFLASVVTGCGGDGVDQTSHRNGIAGQGGSGSSANDKLDLTVNGTSNVQRPAHRRYVCYFTTGNGRTGYGYVHEGVGASATFYYTDSAGNYIEYGAQFTSSGTLNYALTGRPVVDAEGAAQAFATAKNVVVQTFTSCGDDPYGF